MTAVLIRSAPWRPVLGLSAAAASLACGAVGAGARGIGLLLLQVALVVVGGAAACALDEPAAAVVASCPVPRWRQLLARAGAAAVPLFVGLAGVLLWWERAVVDRLLLLQLLGCWVLGLALAAAARARLDEPAEAVASAVVLGLLAVRLVHELGRRLVLFPDGEQVHRATVTWWTLLAGCAVGLVLAVRERRWRAR